MNDSTGGSQSSGSPKKPQSETGASSSSTPQRPPTSAGSGTPSASPRPTGSLQRRVSDAGGQPTQAMAPIDKPQPKAGAYGMNPAPAMPTRNPIPRSSSSAFPTSASSASSSPLGIRPTRVRKARLRLSRIDPWSMMKTSFLFAVAGGIMFWVATYVVWGVIGSSGLFDAVNKAVSEIMMNNPKDTNKFKIENIVTSNKVLGLSALIAVVDIVIFTALATLGSFLYNLSATMLGGLEVTLAED